MFLQTEMLTKFFKFIVSDLIKRIIDDFMLIEPFEFDWHWWQTKFFGQDRLQTQLQYSLY